MAHDAFQQYIVYILDILVSCCRYMVTYQGSDFDRSYKEPSSQIVQDSPSLWRTLWLNRHRVYQTECAGLDLTDNTHSNLRRVVDLLLYEVADLEARVTGYVFRLPHASYLYHPM